MGLDSDTELRRVHLQQKGFPEEFHRYATVSETGIERLSRLSKMIVRVNLGRSRRDGTEFLRGGIFGPGCLFGLDGNCLVPSRLPFT